MRGQLKHLGKHTLVYTAGILIGKVASFVMLPVYTRYLTPADYGVLELLGMTIDVIGMITGVGIAASVFKFYSAETSPSGKRIVMSTAAISVVGLAAATGLLGFVLAPTLTERILGPEISPIYLQLYFVAYLIQNFEYLPFLLMRAENRSVLFVTVNVAKLFMLVSLNILFIVHLQMGIPGILISNIIATTIVATGLTVYLIRQVGVGFNAQKFMELVRFGRSLVLWSLASFVLVFSDRFFLNYYADTATVGIYSLAYKFAWMLTVLAYTPFETMWTAQRFEVAKQADAEQVYARVFRYMNLVLGLVALVLCLFIRDFLSIMSSDDFLPAYRLVPLLAAAQLIFTWGAYWSTGIYIRGKTGVLATGSVVLVAVTLLLNWLLIPWLGAFGAAWATFAAYAIRFFWIYHFAQRDYPIRYDWMEMARLYAVIIGAIALKFAYHPQSLPASTGWSAAILVVATAVIYFVVLPLVDRRGLHDLIRGRSPPSAASAG